MNFRHSSREQDVEISITPLIDVVFILLIFFMVTTTFDRNAELRIDLPEASSKEKPQHQEVLEIDIDANGRYYVNQVEVVGTQAKTLMMAMRKSLQDGKPVPVLIRADAKTPHQAVVTAMDVAGRLGLNRISIATSFSDGQ